MQKHLLTVYYHVIFRISSVRTATKTVRVGLDYNLIDKMDDSFVTEALRKQMEESKISPEVVSTLCGGFGNRPTMGRRPIDSVKRSNRRNLGACSEIS